MIYKCRFSFRNVVIFCYLVFFFFYCFADLVTEGYTVKQDECYIGLGIANVCVNISNYVM